MTIPAAALLAARLDWLEGLLPLLFLLFWIASQVIGVFRKVAGPRQPPVRELPPPEAGDARAELERQIAEFLREATEGRGRPPEPAGPPRRVPMAPGPGRETAVPPRGGLERPRRPQPPKPRPARPESLPVSSPAAASATAADRPLGSLADRGTDVARHVHDAFAQELRHLPSTIGEPAARPAVEHARPQPVLPHDIVALVRNPATIRQLILVREVLERPVDRW